MPRGQVLAVSPAPTKRIERLSQPCEQPECPRLAERDEHDGRILREIAGLKVQLDGVAEKAAELDARIDRLSDNHATLSTSLVSASQMAHRGGIFAAGGSGAIGIYEVVRLVGHALGYW